MKACDSRIKGKQGTKKEGLKNHEDMKEFPAFLYIAERYFKQAFPLFDVDNIFNHSGKLAEVGIENQGKCQEKEQENGKYHVFRQLIFSDPYAFK